MNTKRLRTSLAAAIGGAVLMAGLLVGASFAMAQDSEEPGVIEESENGDSLTRVFGLVEDLIADEAESEDAAADDLARIAEQLQDDLVPLLEEIKDLANTAIDDAVDSGALTEEQAERARDRLERFALPEKFPFLERGSFRFGTPPDFGCFGFRLAPDGLERGEDCPELELPEGFPFGPDGFESDRLPDLFRLPEDFELPEGFESPEGFEFRFGPFGRFGEDLEELVEGLDLDLGELRELLQSGMSLDEALQELGTDLESLFADAREQAFDRIDELVDNGELSEERANRIKEMLEGIDPGEFPSGFRFPDPGRHGPGPWGLFGSEDADAEESLFDA